MASRTSTPRSRSRSSTGSSGSSDTTMPDAPPLAPARPRPASQSQSNPSVSAQVSPGDPAFSLLLSLPRELRDRVYAYALISPFPFWWPAPSSPHHNVALGLLTASRQVYEEAAPILYAGNKFLFTHPSDCNIFRIIASPYASLVSSVYFRIREKDLRLWTSYLSSKMQERSLKNDLPKLKSLWIFLRCGNVPTPGMLGQLGGGQMMANLPPAIAAQVQAVQNMLGAQVQALQQQVQNLTNTIAAVHAQGQAQGQTPPHQTSSPAQTPTPQDSSDETASANTPPNANQIPPPPPHIPQLPFVSQQLQHYLHGQHHPHPHQPPPQPHAHGIQNNPPNPGPLSQHMAQIQQLSHAHAQLQQALPLAHPHHPHHQQHAAQQHQHNFNAFFLRWEREIGLEPLCLSLTETRPPDADVKIVCIMRLPKPEVSRLVRLWPEELAVDRNGDARTRFRRLHGVEVSLEVSGFDVPT